MDEDDSQQIALQQNNSSRTLWRRNIHKDDPSTVPRFPAKRIH